MYYIQIYSYDSMKKLGLLDYVICLNNQDLIEFVNNKFKIKEYLKDYIPILNHVFIVGKDFDFERYEIKEIMQEIFSNLKEQPKVLLLNSLGSILDELEIPKASIITLLDEIAKIDINVIIFETHYTSINKDILELIKKKLPNKQLIIELGFESSNQEYRKKYLNKIIDSDKFIEKVNLIKSFEFDVETNIIFGMPFLSREDQIKDTVQSILWCFQNNIDKVNLFPMNIKPYTLLYKLYETGEYSPVRHKDFIEVLKRIPKEYINKIYLCWYGNRQLYYDSKPTILPICNKEDYDKLMRFYKDFNLHKDEEYRENLLNHIKLLDMED